MLEIAIIASSLLITQTQNSSPKFTELKNQLEQYGFEVVIQLPPKRGAYGLFRVKV